VETIAVTFPAPFLSKLFAELFDACDAIIGLGQVTICFVNFFLNKEDCANQWWTIRCRLILYLQSSHVAEIKAFDWEIFGDCRLGNSEFACQNGVVE